MRPFFLYDAHITLDTTGGVRDGIPGEGARCSRTASYARPAT